MGDYCRDPLHDDLVAEVERLRADNNRLWSEKENILRTEHGKLFKENERLRAVLRDYAGGLVDRGRRAAEVLKGGGE